MSRKRTSQIWLISDDELQSILDKSVSVGAVLIHFGLQNKGNNFKTLKERVLYSNLSMRELEANRVIARTNQLQTIRPELNLNDVLEGRISYVSGNNFKRRLLRDNILANECAVCGIKGIWNNQPLSLQLDHINGNNKDNSLPNLRLLCPNCHSQTETFAGKNNRLFSPGTEIGQKVLKPEHLCICGNKILYKKSKICKTCSGLARRKVERPSKALLLDLLETHSYTAVGKIYGVSDNAIRKWLKDTTK